MINLKVFILLDIIAIIVCLLGIILCEILPKK